MFLFSQPAAFQDEFDFGVIFFPLLEVHDSTPAPTFVPLFLPVMG
jgi:hypothetical protein